MALTAWALRRAGMQAATVARRMVAFLVLLYSVYVGALLVVGLGLYAGLLPGAAAIVVALGAAALPPSLAQRGEGRLARFAARGLHTVAGGVGGVDGGIIAVLLGFGVAPGLAVRAVLTHRVFAFWLPTVPGGMAYLQLRRTVGRWQADPA